MKKKSYRRFGVGKCLDNWQQRGRRLRRGANIFLVLDRQAVQSVGRNQQFALGENAGRQPIDGALPGFERAEQCISDAGGLRYRQETIRLPGAGKHT